MKITFKLKQKILLGIFLPFVLSLVFISIYIIKNYYEDLLKATSKKYEMELKWRANLVNSKIETYFNEAHSLSLVVRSYNLLPENLRRSYLDQVVKNYLDKLDDALAVWIILEKNAIDKDINYVNNPLYGNEVGRMNVGWYRDKNQLVRTAVVTEDEANSADFYQLPKKTLKPTLIPPYYYSYSGIETEMFFEISVITPIIENGKFIGVVGIDIDLNSIKKMLSEAKISEGDLEVLLSENGLIVHAFDEELIGKEISKFKEKYQSDILDNLSKNSFQIIELRNEKYIPFSIKLNYASLENTWALLVLSSYDIFFKGVFQNIERVSLIGAIIFLFLILIVLLFIKKIVSPIVLLRGYAIEIMNGNYNIQMKEPDGGDEISDLQTSFIKMINEIKKAFYELEKEKEELSNYSRQISELKEKAEKEEKDLRKNLSYLSEKFKLLADKKLSFEFVKISHPVFTEINESFAQTKDNLKNSIMEINDASQNLANASEEISSSLEELSAGVNEQSIEMENIKQKLKNTFDNFKRSYEQVEKGKNITISAKNNIKQSEATLKKAIDSTLEIDSLNRTAFQQVKNLGDDIGKIREIAETIIDIAEQTNLLALNAAIEAARAGEHGRGFAVVADEVRKLSERTSKAVKEVEQIVSQIINSSNNAVEIISSQYAKYESLKNLSEKALNEINYLTKYIDDIIGVIETVYQNSSDQKELLEDFENSVNNIVDFAEQTSVVINEISKASNQLSELASRLNNLVKGFELK